MDEQVITSTQMWQLVVAFVILFMIVIIATKIRKRVWIFRQFDRTNKGRIVNWFKNAAESIDDNWGIIVLIEFLGMFIYITAAFTLILGISFLIQAVVFGAAVIIFLFFQLPRLLKPNVHVSLLPCDDKSFYIKTENFAEPIKELKLPTKSKKWFSIYVINLGINNYELLGCWATFDKELNPLPDSLLAEEYKSLGITIDHDRLPKFQQQNNALQWEPNEKLSMAAGDVKIYTVCVLTPEIEGKYPLIVELNSATRWGNTKKRLWLNITKEPI
jgi:hypothetical protein